MVAADEAAVQGEVRGSKTRWAAAVTLINSVGALPIAYFVYGRLPQIPADGR